MGSCRRVSVVGSASGTKQAKVGVDPLECALAQWLLELRPSQPFQQEVFGSEPLFHGDFVEARILVATGHVLRDQQIMDLEAPAPAPVSCTLLEGATRGSVNLPACPRVEHAGKGAHLPQIMSRLARVEHPRFELVLGQRQELAPCRDVRSRHGTQPFPLCDPVLRARDDARVRPHALGDGAMHRQTAFSRQWMRGDAHGSRIAPGAALTGRVRDLHSPTGTSFAYSSIFSESRRARGAHALPNVAWMWRASSQ